MTYPYYNVFLILYESEATAMHCVKTINIERDYGSTRFFLLTSIVFFVTFCLSYISTSYNYPSFHRANYLPLFLLSLFLLYPMHKFFHIILFVISRKPVQLKIVRKYYMMPVIHAEILDIVSKQLYSWALALPFLCLNSFFIYGAFTWPEYAHYFSILLALHCSICLVDLLFLRQILSAPKHAYIEETPKGYEILIQDATY